MYGRTNRPSFGQYDFTLRDLVVNDPSPRPRAYSRPPELPLPLRSLVNVPREPSAGDVDRSNPHSSNSNTRPASKHSRSMSNPFPSLFSKKKKNVEVDSEVDHDDIPDDHDRNKHKMAKGPSQTSSGNGFPPGPTEFITGNCMTCASLVRWPRPAQIIRCTKCLTINDLKPYATSVAKPIIRRPARGGISQSPPNVSSPPVTPAITPSSISLDHTRQLIKTCLRSALLHFMGSSSSYLPTPCAGEPSRPDHSNDYFASRERCDQSGTSLPSSNNCPNIYPSDSTLDDFKELHLEPNPLKKSAKDPKLSVPPYTDMKSSPRTRSPSGTSPGVGAETSTSHQELTSDPKRMFKRIEDYLIVCFGSHSCINSSFVPRRTSLSARGPCETTRRALVDTRKDDVREDPKISELDPKLLLLGNFAENGLWWTGNQDEVTPSRGSSRRHEDKPSIVTPRSPRIDWSIVMEWYYAVNNAASLWTDVRDELIRANSIPALTQLESSKFEEAALEAQYHLQRALLKCTEMLLKRPGRLMVEPQDVRFLLILLANPLLVPKYESYSGHFQRSSKDKGKRQAKPPDGEEKSSMGRHSGIIKRILGLLANSSEICHLHLITWLSKLPEHLFLQTKDLIGTFVTYRLIRQNEKKSEPEVDVTDGLIPHMPNNRAGNTPATLHAALQASKSPRKHKQTAEVNPAPYTDDWQLKAAARVMALLVAANYHTRARRTQSLEGRRHAHILSASDFYNTLVDTLDFKLDFELWESKRGKFTFCQYPFFLSIWAKIQILEFDAKRQMAGKAREAFFDSILSNRNYTQYLTLRVRRECLVEDSLKQVSEVVGSGSEDIKKALRIEFRGEEGVDGGGLRKEWFLLLVREVFNPDHGLFVYDEDSKFCYFNPNTFETSDQYFLVGVVFGLAIYNSTILDVAFPPFAFRKLLAAAPPPAAGTPGHLRPTMSYTLDDLAEFRPALARGLRQLLEFDGDIQSTFCLDFAIDVEKYGSRQRVALCPGGETRMVTNANRREYVDLYVRYLLDTSVTRQFEPFKRGFFTVCASNPLTLFGPEEIELLVRGSDEALDIASLKAVASYLNWPNGKSDKSIGWFWTTFENASPKDQRRLLTFITGSDRIPAMGAASLVIRIQCLGEDEGRYPSARTCFNTLSLYRYQSRDRLEQFLWRAVNESEGFGLK
ncbi:HECT-domain-containing protein [Xylariaceae sp. FL1272]|nr:HECT-domain-containing protein [Xylariaceae sp. FL1272]